MNFYDCYLSYLDYVKIKQKVQSYNSIVGKFKIHILPYFKDFDINDICFTDYLNWQKIIDEKDYSYCHKRNLHCIFSAFLEFCVNCYGLKNNVAKQVGNFPKNKCIKNKLSFYTYDEFLKFSNGFDNIIYKYFFHFLFFTGVRPGEAMALKFSDLNNNFVSINKTIDEHGKREFSTPKTLSSYRTICIDEDLVLKLDELKNFYNKIYFNEVDFYVFGGLKPLAPTTINRYKIKACQKSNIKPIRLHDFRHSHATLLIDNGVPINEVSRRLGHGSIVTTLNVYVHNNLDNEKRVMETLNSIKMHSHSDF